MPPKQKSRGNDSRQRGCRQKRATLTTQTVEQIVREQTVGTTSKRRLARALPPKQLYPPIVTRLRTSLVEPTNPPSGNYVTELDLGSFVLGSWPWTTNIDKMTSVASLFGSYCQLQVVAMKVYGMADRAQYTASAFTWKVSFYDNWPYQTGAGDATHVTLSSIDRPFRNSAVVGRDYFAFTWPANDQARWWDI